MNVIPLPDMAAGREKLSWGGVAPSPHFNVVFSDSQSKLRLSDFNIELGEGGEEQELQARRSKIEMCITRVWYRGVAGSNKPGSAPLPMWMVHCKMLAIFLSEQLR